MSNIKYLIKEFWYWLNSPSKAIFIIMSLVSLFYLSQGNIFHCFIIWLVGNLIFISISQFCDYIDKKAKKSENKQQLEYYKSNFSNLDDAEKWFYKTSISLKLDRVKTLSIIANNTKNIRVFTKTFNEIIENLSILSEHEYTGYFQGTPPSFTLEDLKANRFLSEIAFIKRTFPSNVDERNAMNNIETKYLVKYFSPQAIDYFKTGKEYAPIEPELTLEQESQPQPIIPDYKEVNFDNMDGHDFEYFCAELLRKNGYINVEVTKGSSDQGIDVIACKDGVKYGIQCKCYSHDVGNKAVQEAYSGAKFYDCHVPVVLTNRYFTPSAIELATKNNVLLWDRDKLNNMINLP